MKNNKGITLVALVITIIVLIILAGISITMVLGQDGLIGKSKDGAEKYKESASNEEELLANIDEFIDDNSAIYTEYVIGQEVTVGGEQFYVLENSGSSKSKVVLLAKYNLNQAGTAQAPNATLYETNVVFSSTNYWNETQEAYTNWTNKLFDINSASGEVSGDAIYKAKAYATAKGGTDGRLLTYEEADSLKSSYGDMIWGTANEHIYGHYLIYWLSSSPQGNIYGVYLVYGNDQNINYDSYYDDSMIGVRPVITVSKTLIQ